MCVKLQLLSVMQCDALQLHTLSSAALQLCSRTSTLNKWTCCLAEQVEVSADVCMNLSQQDARHLSALKQTPFLQTAACSLVNDEGVCGANILSHCTTICSAFYRWLHLVCCVGSYSIRDSEVNSGYHLKHISH